MALTDKKRAELNNGIFEDWSEAFAVCREGNAPLIVREIKETAEKGKWKIFPSGHVKRWHHGVWTTRLKEEG